MKALILIFCTLYSTLVFAEEMEQAVTGDNSNAINDNSGTITIIYNSDEKRDADASKELKTSIVRVARGYTEDLNRYQIILYNPNRNPALASKATLRWTGYIIHCLCLEPPCSSTYRIKKDTKYLVKDGEKNDIERFDFQVESVDGFTTLASGYHRSGCGWNGTEIDVNISVVLQPKTFTAIYIDVPSGMAPASEDVEVFISTNAGRVSFTM